MPKTDRASGEIKNPRYRQWKQKKEDYEPRQHNKMHNPSPTLEQQGKKLGPKGAKEDQENKKKPEEKIRNKPRESTSKEKDVENLTPCKGGIRERGTKQAGKMDKTL